MNPLFTNGIDATLLTGLQSRTHEREPMTRRKRRAGEADRHSAESAGMADNEKAAEENPKHTLDDLA